MTRSPTWRQQNYRLRNDDGTMSAATWIADENTAGNVQNGSNFRLRIDIGDTNNATTGNTTGFKLQFAVNGGTWTDVGGATAISTANSTYHTDGAADNAQRLSGVTGADAGWQVTWTEFIEDGVSTSRTWTDDYTEYEFSLKANSVSVGDTITFRLATTGGTAITPVNTATANIVAVSIDFQFDQAAVSTTGQSVTFQKDLPVTAASITPTVTSVILERMAEPGYATLAGSSITFDIAQGDTSLAVDHAALSTTGQAVSLDTSGNLAVTQASLSVTGQTIDFTGSGELLVTQASLSISGAATVLERMAEPGTVTLTGSDVTLSAAATNSVDVDYEELSVTGQAITFDKSLIFDASSLSSTGSTITFGSGEILDVDAAALSPVGTSVIIERMAEAASLSVAGQDISFQPVDSIDVSPASLTVVGQFFPASGLPVIDVEMAAIDIIGSPDIDVEEAREFDFARPTITGSTITFANDRDLPVTQAVPTLTASSIATTAAHNCAVVSASLIAQGQDVTYVITGQTAPDLQVEPAYPSVQGQIVGLDPPPIEVVHASLTAQGRDVTLTPVGIGNNLPVDAGTLGLSGASGPALEWVGPRNFQVDHATLVLTPRNITFNFTYNTENFGRIDGKEAHIINTFKGGVLLYPKNGGYYIISSNEG